MEPIERKYGQLIKINGQHQISLEAVAADLEATPIVEYSEQIYSTWVNTQMIETVTSIDGTALLLTLISGQRIYVGFVGNTQSLQRFPQKVAPIKIKDFAQWLQ